jgi:hypothetical protein
MEYWIGVAFLIACAFGAPYARKLQHDRRLKTLGLEGATVVGSWLGLSGLRLKRARWEGEVEFDPGGLGGGGRPGHLQLTASLGRRTPTVRFHEKGRVNEARLPGPPIPTGDAAFDAKILVQGDPTFARQLLGPEQRERLLRLEAAGGHLWCVDGGIVQLGGPLIRGNAELKRFLELCDAILDAMAAGLPA